LRCIRACSALEALRNALYKCSTYLLTSTYLRELPQWGPGRIPGRQRIVGIVEAHITLLVERTVLLY